MTSNNRLKKQARDYATAHGVAYAEARRRLIEQMQAQSDPTQMRVLTIQQVERPDGVLPYPFHLDEAGFVGNQMFWKGDPLRLIGFVDTEDSRTVTVDRDTFLADPDTALGKHPVFLNRDTHFTTHIGPVESVEVAYVERVLPSTVMARVGTSDGSFDLSVGVGHLMENLHKADLRVLRAAGWQPPVGSPAHSVSETLLGWLISADGGQDLGEVDRLFNFLDEHGVDPDAPDDGGVTVEVFLDPGQAEAWLARTHPHLLPPLAS